MRFAPEVGQPRHAHGRPAPARAAPECRVAAPCGGSRRLARALVASRLATNPGLGHACSAVAARGSQRGIARLGRAGAGAGHAQRERRGGGPRQCRDAGRGLQWPGVLCPAAAQVRLQPRRADPAGDVLVSRHPQAFPLALYRRYRGQFPDQSDRPGHAAVRHECLRSGGAQPGRGHALGAGDRYLWRVSVRSAAEDFARPVPGSGGQEDRPDHFGDAVRAGRRHGHEVPSGAGRQFRPEHP
ncbi:hypothetical protein D9M68_728310 [compost metagenome]